MFQKVLIANRGEIACRVIKACHELGIRAVAVHSEIDAQAKHVLEADEAYHIGEAPVAKSYLQADRIIEVARNCGADAIHPGYGLLAENPRFAEKCAEAGLTFIGPPPHAIQAMGNKTQARRLMKEAGVPVIPGTNDIPDVDVAIDYSNQIGYPVMVKAAAGGGGIGIQIANSDEELAQAYKACSSRAKANFNDGTVYLEKYLDDAHHVEVQIVADETKTIHVNERECSIQRRHQKVIEESPSPNVSDSLRQALGTTAIQAAQAIGYRNVGTVEFLLTDDGTFYFLEMNTRIQVEHPVTELVSGIDLVKEQIRIAAGESMSFEQSDVQISGHAIECRLYAENPKTFLPSPGPIDELEFPVIEGLRIDTGVSKGDKVTPYYDPLVAKVITHGRNRNEAIAKMRQALEGIKIGPITTNLSFLHSVLEHPVVIEGRANTQFLKTYGYY